MTATLNSSIYVKNQVRVEKLWNFWEKIEILEKKTNFGQKKNLDKHSNFRQKTNFGQT